MAQFYRCPQDVGILYDHELFSGDLSRNDALSISSSRICTIITLIPGMMFEFAMSSIVVVFGVWILFDLLMP